MLITKIEFIDFKKDGYKYRKYKIELSWVEFVV